MRTLATGIVSNDPVQAPKTEQRIVSHKMLKIVRKLDNF